MKRFLLPDLGEGLAESEIIEWHVSEGDHVELDQTVLTVETAKAVVEVPAPYSGTIIKRYGSEGDVVNIGTLLLEIEESEAAVSVASTQTADAATVVGNVSQAAHHVAVDNFWVGNDSNHNDSSPVIAMPSARLLAKKLGVNIDSIEGTGDKGLITDDDIYHEAGRQQPGTEVLKGARRTMVSTMTESHHNVASVTITEEANLINWPEGEDISSRLIQAVVYACQKEPALNAWFDADTMTRCVHSTVNIGIAVDSAHGLYVPVLRHADTQNPEQVRQWLNETVKGIRERKIGREQLQHATITLSNFGAIAGIYATPVVSPPQVAIVGAGRIIDKLTLVNNQPVMTKAMPLSITFDHRACTGGEAARFTKKLVEHLEK
ncbi:dihydrolipoamide acetyltransferase family protein [Vibrio sp. 16]|uniref:dihydrolipoamide acetyltransferase family protein n=1 Tax=Vibrio sp. 16 TaxID=391586 RepID=UPI00018F2789|nr:dihydrolipoamide acetyltransferase family protein [Vibrio sp. 16]EED26172.1 pyruvate dehydrogenase complex E2 component, dihydrolipoamide acetyltransferase [Vibrio sp. 16]CAK4075661.1 Dihydrolipoyllysine-residue acetyltransferase component of pyruvate dehydrogenase complex [Vibrio sp. 16]